MALKTLSGIEEIGGFSVFIEPDSEHYEDSGIQRRPNKDQFISIDLENSTIEFTIQDGPVKEVGVNGCQVDTLIETALIIIEKLNKNYPCIENEDTIMYLKQAIDRLNDRKTDREQRGVEGFSKN